MRIFRVRRVSWFVIGPAVLLAIAFCMWMYSKDSRALTDLTAEELRLRMVITQNQQQEQSLRIRIDSVGTSAQLETEARKQDFMKPGEMRFEVANPELLDKYTESEWEILMAERKLGQF